MMFSCFRSGIDNSLMIHEKGPVDAGCIGSGSIVVVHEDVPNLDATAAGDDDSGGKHLLPSRILS